MKELLYFLQSNVPSWLTQITAPLTLIAKRVTSTDIPQIRLLATPQTVKTLGTYKVPANSRRKQIIISADVIVSLRTYDDRHGMTLAAATPWTVETTDAINIYNGTAGPATVEILQFLYD